MAKINPAGRKKVLGYRSIYLKFNLNVVYYKLTVTLPRGFRLLLRVLYINNERFVR